MYDQIAPYYDSLYAGKDYERECDFLEEILGHGDVQTILDVGCGSGRHAGILTARGYQLFGIDQSTAMIEQAKCNYPHVSFAVMDARSLEVPGPYDAAISMFGTMTYFTSIDDLQSVLAGLHDSIRPGGLLIFDGWNSDAVTKAVPPNGRLERVGENLIKFTEMIPVTSEISNSRLTIIDINKGKVVDYKTPLRLFSREAIADLLGEIGFELISYWRAFEQVAPTDNDWKVSIVARRK